jgi:hypothetical protein
MENKRKEKRNGGKGGKAFVPIRIAIHQSFMGHIKHANPKANKEEQEQQIMT